MIKRLDFRETKKQYNIASCGTKAMQQAIRYKKGIYIPEVDLMRIANPSRKGTPIESMLRMADKFDLNYFLKHNSSIQDLINSIDGGNPVILSTQRWPNKKVKDWLEAKAFGHYEIIVGYDTKEEKIYCYDPYDGKIKTTCYEKLHLIWHDMDFKSKIEYKRFGMFFLD
jgi:hypothetical protein